MTVMPRVRRAWYRLPTALAGLFLAGVVGCGNPNIHPVEGKVLFKDGTPLTEGTVVFEPVRHPNRR